MSAVLEAHELGRWYGQVVGLNELTVAVEPGISGLVGPNGAGKSTFLKLIAGEIRPSRGHLTVLGEEPFANRALYRRLGFCPQQDALYDDMSGFAIVRMLLRLSGYGAGEARRRAEAALTRTGLAATMHRPAGGYSKGMRQRVKLAQAIAHDPELLILDEPLTGLDPIGRHEVFSLLRELAGEGMSILLSSHVLHEIETLTQDILLLHRGRLLAQGSVAEVRSLLNRHPRRVELRAARPRELAQALLGCEEVVAVQLAGEDGLRLETRDVGAFYAELTALAAGAAQSDGRGFGISALESADASLEAVFDYLVS